jgi:hypothetical protein
VSINDSHLLRALTIDKCIGVITDSVVVVTSVLLLLINVLIICHHIALICTARVIHHQHRLHHGSGGYLLACNHGSRGSIPDQFMLICDGEIARFFCQYFCFPICIILRVLHGQILSPVDTV